MLKAHEQKRYKAQCARLHAIDQRIAAVAAAIPGLLPPIQEEAQETLKTLRRNRADLWGAFPKGSVMSFFDPMNDLSYDDSDQ